MTAPIGDLRERGLRHGLDVIGPGRDERGYGFVLYDLARKAETGPPWMPVGSRMTLAEVERALDELEDR